MKGKILNLIKNEDKKNALTDEEISKILNIRREEVTFLRNKLGIEDSRRRRKIELLKAIEDIRNSNKEINKSDITKELNYMGFSVSRFTVNQYLKEIEINHSFDTNLDQINQKNRIVEVKKDAFDELIGSQGSLKSIVKLAKAAVLYPPNGLHTIIMGPTGVGKSELAECMYKFVLETRKSNKQIPFVVFNAADYSENPQLLLSQLFGHVKGAFTGADETKDGLVSKADGGILFIDEIHRLPHEGQEILFQLMDKGKVRRLGETKLTNNINVMIISATSEPIDSYLLNTFKRRIPVTIEIPEIKERPLKERFEIINKFFKVESQRMGLKIRAKSDVIRAFMLYECTGNAGQLKSDIQVACARGLLNKLINNTSEVVIEISELPTYVKQGLIKSRNSRSKIEKYIDGDLIIDKNNNINTQKIHDDIYSFPDEIYKLAEQRHIELLEQGIDLYATNRIVSGELESYMQKYMNQLKKISIGNTLSDVESIVGSYIVEITQDIINMASKDLKYLDKSLLFSLAIHIKSVLERIKEGKIISNTNLDKIIKNYPLEFSVAKKVGNYLKDKYKINLPKEEIGIIALYFQINKDSESANHTKIGVLLMAHGRVASSICDVANALLGTTHAKALDMSLDKSPESMIDEAKKVIAEIDEGKGVIMLVDMGSLSYFGDIISSNTNIDIRTISRFDTLLAIEVIRKSVIPDITIDEIVNDIKTIKPVVNEKNDFIKEENKKEKEPIILSLCITGVGGAYKIKSMLENEIPGIDHKVKIETIGIIEYSNIEYEIDQIRKKKNIILIVGTINPNIIGIPFFSIYDIQNKMVLNEIKDIVNQIELDYYNQNYELCNLIDEDLIEINKDFSSKSEVIQYMSTNLKEKGYVVENFKNKIIDRENLYSTELAGGIAIPHADGVEVVKPAISILVLNNPILWNTLEVNIVIMLAVDNKCFNPLSKLFNYIETKNIHKIEKIKDRRKIKEFILNGVK